MSIQQPGTTINTQNSDMNLHLTKNMEEGVKVIGSKYSVFCTRVEWALKLKGVEHEYLVEDLRIRARSETLLKYNPVHKKIPVLVHNGKPVAESLIILEYIDQTWEANPLMPQHPYEKATARFWAKFGDEKCLMGTWEAFMLVDGEEKEKAIGAAKESFDFLEKQLQGNKFFGGEEIGYLDLALGWIPLWLNVLEQVGEMKILDANRFPLIVEWTHNFTRPAIIKDCLPPRDHLVNYFTSSLSAIRSSPQP